MPPKGKPFRVRLAVARAYLAFLQGEGLRAEPPAQAESSADKRLYVQLLKGMVRHKRFLEAEVARMASKPFTSLDETLVALAVMGLFQLRFLNLPPHAAINETVALAARLRRKHGTGWVNALLRTAQREGLLGRETPQALTLAQETSHPDWLVDRWIAQFGPERTRLLCEANNLFQGAAIRVETRRISPEALLKSLAGEGVRVTPHPLLATALWVENLGEALASPAFAEGLCYVQDAGSQLLMAWAAPLLQRRVLDVCAAPGGKFTALLNTPITEGGTPRSIVAGHSDAQWIVAADSDPRRLPRVRENLLRLQMERVPLLVADGARLPFGPVWDSVLLDVPCSATGMIRKYPELKWQKHAEDLPALVKTQQALLAEAARVTRPGGVILYATCSLEHEENAGVVDAFLKENPHWSRVPFSTLNAHPGWEGEAGESAQVLTPQGDLLLLPGDAWMGIYGSLLRRGG